MKDEKRTCGDCEKRLTDGCPRYEYKNYEDNLIACPETAEACEKFKEKKKEKQTKPVYKDSGACDLGPFEAIYNGENPAFLVKTQEGFGICETVACNGKTFHPKDAKRVPYLPYGYYQSEVLNREDLFWKVRRELQRFVDVEPIWIDVLGACVLFSYQQEKLQTVPYVFLYGDNESGKSTVLQVLKFLCYRPMFGVTVPAADLFGYLDDVDSIGCILEDEIQGIDKDIDKVKIYKAGYKQGAVVPRILITQFDRVIKYYNTFCFKVCASEQIPKVKGFRERFIEIPMIEGYPEKEWTDVTQEDLKTLHDLRNMLLKWRLLSKEWQLPNPELQMRGRLKELWKPILQITEGLTVYDTLLGFVEEQKKERLSGKQNTLEGHIVKVVSELYNREPIPFPVIWDQLVSELEGKLDEKKPHQMDTSEFFTVTKSKVGYRLREVLSGRSKDIRYEEGVTKGYQFDEKKLSRVVKKYGFDLVAKLPTETSSKDMQAPISTLTPPKNDVEKEVYAPLEVGKLSNLATEENVAITTPISSWEWEGFHVIGSYTPDVAYKKTVNSLREHQGKQTLTSRDVEQAVAYYWTEESRSKVWDRLLKDGVVDKALYVVSRLRAEWTEDLTEEEIIERLAQGLTPREAKGLFEDLAGTELFWYDKEGKTVWKWCFKS